MTLPIMPITDRTRADVSYAEAHRDSAAHNKGALNASDLNRIESNSKYLADQLNSYGYYVSISVKTNWTEMDFPTRGQIDRIRRNINALIACYSKLQGSPEILFRDTLDWNDANSLEQNIQNIETLLQRMINGFRYCGGFNFYCGEGVVLP